MKPKIQRIERQRDGGMALLGYIILAIAIALGTSLGYLIWG